MGADCKWRRVGIVKVSWPGAGLRPAPAVCALVTVFNLSPCLH